MRLTAAFLILLIASPAYAYLPILALGAGAIGWAAAIAIGVLLIVAYHSKKLLRLFRQPKDTDAES
jgi:hypothetical protein